MMRHGADELWDTLWPTIRRWATYVVIACAILCVGLVLFLLGFFVAPVLYDMYIKIPFWR